LIPSLKSQSLVCTVNQQDAVWVFTWSFPFHPINREDRLTTYHMVEPGTSRDLKWRQEFATHALAAWKDGGDVWVTQRVQSQRPQPQWIWAEGDARHCSWTDIHTFFSQLELAPAIEKEDGFTLLLPSAKNKRILVQLSQEQE